MHDLIYDPPTETDAFEEHRYMGTNQPSTAETDQDGGASYLEQIAALKEAVRMKNAAISWFIAEIAELTREFEELKLAATKVGCCCHSANSEDEVSAPDEGDGSPASEAATGFTSQLFSLHYRLEGQVAKGAEPVSQAADAELDAVDGF